MPPRKRGPRMRLWRMVPEPADALSIATKHKAQLTWCLVRVTREGGDVIGLADNSVSLTRMAMAGVGLAHNRGVTFVLQHRGQEKWACKA